MTFTCKSIVTKIIGGIYYVLYYSYSIYIILLWGKTGEKILDNVLLLLYILLYIRDNVVANKNKKAVDYVRPPLFFFDVVVRI